MNDLLRLQRPSTFFISYPHRQYQQEEQRERASIVSQDLHKEKRQNYGKTRPTKFFLKLAAFKMTPTMEHQRSLSLSSLITHFCKCSVSIAIGLVALLLTAGGTGSSAEAAVLSSLSYSNLEYDTAMNWDHVVDLNEDFRVYWTIINQDITFEIQVRTLGYVGFGFSKDGNQIGADMAVGWVDGGHTFFQVRRHWNARFDKRLEFTSVINSPFQDRYVDELGSAEPKVDPSQDYSLMKGYENSTHTVLRFRRKLDTCDNKHDIVITVSV